MPNLRYPLALCQERSRCRTHIETGLGTKTGFLKVCPDSSLHYLEYLKPRILRGNFPLPLFQEMSRYENHIETGLGTKNGLFEVYPDF
jgi:hypothetical protein